jgi:hypothetical protein
MTMKYFKQLNKKLESAAKEKWKLTNEMRQLQMNCTIQTRSLNESSLQKRSSHIKQRKEEINWYCYQKVILEFKLILLLKSAWQII